MPQTIADIDAANRAHPTTRLLPTEEQVAEQRARRLKVAMICAAAGVGALAVAGGVYYAFRAGWLGSPPPKRLAWRTYDAVTGAVGDAACAVNHAVGDAWQRIKAT